MRILHLGKYYSPYPGGMESVVKSICEGLVQEGNEVHVLCSNDRPKHQEEVLNNVTVSRMKRWGTFFGQCLNFSILNQLKKLIPKFDIIHIHSPNPLIEMACLMLPKSIPMVTTYHSDIVRQKRLKALYAPFFKAFLKRMNKIFVATENHIEFSEFLPDFRNKCVIIPFGLDEKKFEKTHAVDGQISRLQVDEGEYGLFVGRMVGYKGIPVLLNSLVDSNNKIILVGEGPELENYKKLAKELGVEKQARFYGKVEDHSTFLALYHSCKFLVLPSVTPNENFGIVQLEAMVCSKPVITTNLKSGVPAVGQKGETCLIVEPGNVEQLSKAISMLWSNPELCKRLGDNGRARFLKMYTINAMIDSHISEYELTLNIQDLINKHRSAA